MCVRVCVKTSGCLSHVDKGTTVPRGLWVQGIQLKVSERPGSSYAGMQLVGLG